MYPPRRHLLHVITGLVPVIPIVWNAAPHRIGMAGTRPAMTWEGVMTWEGTIRRDVMFSLCS